MMRLALLLYAQAMASVFLACPARRPAWWLCALVRAGVVTVICESWLIGCGELVVCALAERFPQREGVQALWVVAQGAWWAAAR